ncbi:transposable element Tcb2 transposase [Trichonephila clavipes]|nr:transposable element Tcb2 transposase [Trichonephila clavipes]
MARRNHLDDFTRGRMIGKLEEGRTVTSVAAELGINKSVVSHAWKAFQTTGKGICSLNHSENDCKEIKIKIKKCCSCGEDHEANDKGCKRYQKEVEILKIKVQQQISRNEAVEKFQREKTLYSAKTYNDQTEKIDNLEKKFAKLELKFEENNNIFEKKLEQIVQHFTTELNTIVTQINLSFSSLMNTMESSLKKLASNTTIPKDDDFLINRKLNEKAKRFKKISEQRGNTLESVVKKKI